MRRFKDTISNTSNFLFVFTTIVLVAVILNPSPLELLVLCLGNCLFFYFVRSLEFRLFQIVFPETSHYFPTVNYRTIGQFTVDEKISLFESFTKFPKRKSYSRFFSDFVKLIPSYLIIVFHWDHSISNEMQFALCLAGTLMASAYLCGVTFTESHSFLSELLNELHEKYDFSEAFKQARISSRKSDFEIKEITSIIFLILSGLVFQWVVILANWDTSGFDLALKLTALHITGILLFVRIWYLGKKYLIGGLEKISQRMELLTYKKDHTTVPLHTSPLLAQFERTFNILIRRLELSQQELSSLVLQEADKGRFRALGEMSAMIAHDLGNPLHVAQYCVTSLKENPGTLRQDKYLEHLSANISRAVELISSLQARIRNSSTHPTEVAFADAHHHTIRLMKTQYSGSFGAVQFELDPALFLLRLQLQRVDLTHILDNLYRNSVNNLLSNSIENPWIQVRLEEIKNEVAHIVIQDNGTGLDQVSFEEITGLFFLHKKLSPTQQWLGLRLTRRLIELNQGELNLIPSDDGRGTKFRLSLRLCPPRSMDFDFASLVPHSSNELEVPYEK